MRPKTYLVHLSVEVDADLSFAPDAVAAINAARYGQGVVTRIQVTTIGRTSAPVTEDTAVQLISVDSAPEVNATDDVAF